MDSVTFDVAIVGGGIIGLATAMAICTRWPHVKLVVLEKEPTVGAHQTSHNSGVVHSGIYYRPGSVKAKTCVAGARLLVEFCRAHRIPHLLCGKLIIATEASELPALETLYQRGVANGVSGITRLGPEGIRELEPHAHGIKALHVPSAGIVDYTAVAHAFAETVQRTGGEIRTAARVARLLRRESLWMVETTTGEVRAKQLITCGGLQADRLAARAWARSDLRIVPFRGDYYALVPERCGLVKGMIYPVPNPALPFLGVHLTRTVAGSVHVGPNAVLAFKREGYRKTDVDLFDTLTMLSHAGFWRMAWKYRTVGLQEFYRAWSKRVFVQTVQRLVPEVRSEDLIPSGSGVRAQALDARGVLIDDFNIVEGPQAIHVRNVPSPAATASIRIGQIIADRAARSFTP